MSAPETAADQFKMTISLNVLNHLGINLYSNIPAVLSELVANAYDADATLIEITIGDDEILVKDDGVGMTHDEVNSRFLNVGYDKRNDTRNPFSRLTAKGRLPMGRKGIGKLSVFSIAETVEVHTARDGECSAFEMSLPEVRAAIQDRNSASDYFPPPVEPCEAAEGTTIKLRDLKKRTASTAAFLRRRLARRFAVQGGLDSFVISVDGTPISVEDRDYFKKVQFLWYLGPESSGYAALATQAEKTAEIQATEVRDRDGHPVGTVSGWIGTVEKPSDIEEQDNVIVLLARKKLIHEDILRQFQEAGIYADYLVGEINADFLDADDFEDVVTSDRQRIKEDDPRYEALRDFLTKNVLKRIQGEWTDLRLEVGRKKAIQNPVVAEWLASHTGDTRRVAEKMLARVETFKFVDSESKVELYKASIMGFERLALRDSLSALDKLDKQEDFDATMRVLASVDELEAAHYHQIVKSRLDVIRTLKAKLPTEREKIIQRYLFEHLWLLDPSWERATNIPPIEEEAIKTAFKGIDAKLSPEEAAGRVDIRFQKVGGEHVIVELKKFDRKVTVMELVVQIEKYVNALHKCLTEQLGQHSPAIRAVCLVGERPSETNERTLKAMEAVGGRVMTYGEMIAQAEAGYADYLESDTKVGKIAQLVERLEKTLGSGPAS
ncbi:ATP-binding protein [Deinococcus sp. AJ005]|uniref:BbrUII/HgiDII family restriction enzyme n=1 Tax=Deinococcus sp. AJ005 TaxID=2652443 RepID=UPI001865894E|nr:ATP-binding protein [Deinococcus sp. AJ005]